MSGSPKPKVRAKAKMTRGRAAEIVNDIHESCCRASRKELMECASFLSLENCYLYQEVSTAYAGAATDALTKLGEFRKRYN